MSYLINRYSGQTLVVLEDGNLDTTTSLGLLGRNYTGYGEIQNENFLFLLENFANARPPARPISGQLWYKTDDGTLNVYNGTEWRNASSAVISTTQPAEKINGTVWFDSGSDQLYVFNNDTWNLIGPEGIEGYQSTRFKSQILLDTSGISHPVILIQINGVTIGIVSNTDFDIRASNPVPGFDSVAKGINLSSAVTFKGSLAGNAETATRLQTARNINGVPFSGVADISITANTTTSLTPGDYILGSSFNGSSARQWSVSASSSNTPGKLVARDSSGSFTAGTITADFVGTLTGNVNAASGTSTFDVAVANEFIGANLSGNAATATALETSRNINGVPFNGTNDITVAANAFTLTNTRLAPNVVQSDLTTLGILNSLFVENAGVQVGSTLKLYYNDEADVDLIESSNEFGLVLSSSWGANDENLERLFLNSPARSAALGMEGRITLRPPVTGGANIGGASYRYNRMFANNVNAPTIETQTINSTAGDNSITVGSSLIVSGNLVVNGVTTTINSTEVAIDDLSFTVARNAADPIAANGAGLYVGGALANISYSATGDKWTINKKLDAGNNNIITTGLFQGTATSARYADLAEKYLADAEYEPGTVLEFGGKFEVTMASDETRRVAGVVSSKPAFTMNDELTGQYVAVIALQGRVPCKVRGKICKGDMLVSGGSGYARPTVDPKIGTIIGKALEDFDGIEGVIEVVVGRL